MHLVSSDMESYFPCLRGNTNRVGDLPGELDVVKDDEGALDVEDGAVVDTGRDVVVAHGGASVHNLVRHFTRIVCCFLVSCSGLWRREPRRRRSRVSDSVLQSADAYL